MLEQIEKAILTDIKAILTKVMSSGLLVNKKTGHNTIYPDSDLFKQLKMVSTNDNDLVFDIMLNDYVQYIESGRRSNRKFPPVQPIIQWCKKHGIPTDNSTIFLIRRAIARDGIRPRPFMYKVFEMADKAFDEKWSDVLFDEILTNINEFFND